MPNFSLQQDDFQNAEENDYDNATPIANFGDSASANFELGWLGTAVGNAWRWGRRKSIEMEHASEAPTSPEELNKKFPNLQKPFEEPMNVYVAGEIAFQQEERKRLEEVISAGPQTASMKVAGFGMGVLAHALDPLELGAGQLVGGAIQAGFLGARMAQVTTKAAQVGRLGLVQTAEGLVVKKGAKLAIGEAAGLSLVEGGIGNTAIEIPEVMQAQAEHREYGVSDALTNIAIGTLGYTTITSGFRLGARMMKRAEVEVAHTATTGQLLNDRVPTTGDTLSLNESKVNHLETDPEFRADPQVVNDAAQKSLSPESKIDYSPESQLYLDKSFEAPKEQIEIFKAQNEELAPHVKAIEAELDIADHPHLKDLNEKVALGKEEESLWSLATDCVLGLTGG